MDTQLIAAVGVVVVVLVGLAATAAYALGALHSERASRSAVDAVVREQVRAVVTDALSDLQVDVKADVEDALKEWLGFGREETKPGVMYSPPPPVEARAAQELTDSSLETIRQGLQDEYGISGKDLDGAMADVKRHFGVDVAG